MNSYQQGLVDETGIIQTLQAHGHTVTPSTRDENIKDDIDCYVDGVPVSIKTQHSAEKYGNFVFEMYVQRRDNKEWHQSWYYHSKATYYIICIGTQLFKVDKAKLTDWVQQHGFEKYTTLSMRVQDNQDSINHLHTNAKLGLVKQQTLLDAGIAERLPYDTTIRKVRPIGL